jgi:hypothetical protein
LALTPSDFTTRFPEFRKTDLNLIGAKLGEAERFVHRPALGKWADDLVGNYAAHLIALNPLGESARQKKRDDGRTPYLDTYERILKKVVRVPRAI